MSRSPVAFGPYVITRRIARGGMAEIYRARTKPSVDAPSGWVAVKLMRPSLGHEELREQLFKREARIASAIAHKNVVMVHEFGRELDRYYIAMEYLRGRDLSHLIRGKEGAKDFYDLALCIGVQAAAGLGYAHRLTDEVGAKLEIVHRDISPGNVIVGYDGVAKVLDFGVARINETQGLRTQTGTLRGKFAYMSPEQTLGTQIDARSDVFSLGTLLYELLTGTNPFRAKAPITSLERVQRVRPVPPSRVNKRIPKEVDMTLARCLAKDPRRRFKDAYELHEQLAELLDRRGLDPVAELASYMSERFSWEAQEEERELREEEEEVALLDVVEFSLSQDDPRLDAPRLTISHEEEASQSEASRASASEAQVRESELGVFEDPESPFDTSPQLPPTRSPSLATTPDAARTFREGAPEFLAARQQAAVVLEERPQHEEFATMPISLDQAPHSMSIEASSLFEEDSAPVVRDPSTPLTAMARAREESVARSEMSDPMLRALATGAQPAADRASAFVDSTEDSIFSFRRRINAKVAGGIAVLLAVFLLALRGFVQPDEPPPKEIRPRRTEPVAKIAPVQIAPVEVDVEEAAEEPLPDGEPDADELAKVEVPPVTVSVTENKVDPEPVKPKTERRTEPKRSETKRSPRGSRTRSERKAARRSSETRAAPAEPRRPRKSAIAQVGFLNVAAQPWAEFEIDGKKWPYQTPQGGIELSAGRHVVVLRNSDTKVTKRKVVTIVGGKTKTLNVNMGR